MSIVSLRTQIKEDHLTCSICFNYFTKPKALPCIHTFCENCLRDYVVSRGYEESSVFPCPVCREITNLPPNGVEGFPDNHIMSSLSDTVSESNSSRPVPKPRKSLGQAAGYEEENTSKQTNELPPSYSSVADSNPQHNEPYLTKKCINDTDPGWLVVPKASDPVTPTSPNLSDFCVVSDKEFSQQDKTIPQNTSSTDNSSSGMLYPQPLMSYPQTQGPTTENQPVIGWNIQQLDQLSSNNSPNLPTASPPSNDLRQFNTHTPLSSQQGALIYPTVPSNLEYSNTACSENLYLKFGKQGSTLGDFLKPIGLAVSNEGHYIISDGGGDVKQNRIFIYNSGGDITRAFKTACKIKDITISRNNEILGAVNKNVVAIRHFTLGGQCKGEYGKFFTYESPCGIAAFTTGGVVLCGPQNQCIYIMSKEMKLLGKFGRKGKGDGYFQQPSYAAINSKDQIIISDKGNHEIQVFYPDGKFKCRFGSEGCRHGQLKAPMGVCADLENHIIVADSGNYRVEAFTSRGKWLSTVVSGTDQLGENVRPVNVAITPTGKVAVLLRGPYFAEVRVYSSKHRMLAENEQHESHFKVITSCW